ARRVCQGRDSDPNAHAIRESEGSSMQTSPQNESDPYESRTETLNGARKDAFALPLVTFLDDLRDKLFGDHVGNLMTATDEYVQSDKVQQFQLTAEKTLLQVGL